MMNFIIRSIGLSLVIILASCDNKSANATPENGQNMTVETENALSDTCIYGYIDKYDQLLTLEDIKKYYTGDMSAAKFMYNKSENKSNQDKDKALHSWDVGRIRKMKIMDSDMEMPDNNEIGLNWLGSDLFMINGMPTPLECFKKFYRNVSKEEMDAAMGKGEKFLQEKHGISAAQAKEASDMGKSLAEGQTFEDVSGVGEAATWKAKDSELRVLVGDKTFGVIARVGTDAEVNKSLAIALAKEVLGKCK